MPAEKNRVHKCSLQNRHSHQSPKAAVTATTKKSAKNKVAMAEAILGDVGEQYGAQRRMRSRGACW